MNWLVELALVLKRASLILIGSTLLRIRAAMVSSCLPRGPGLVHSALAVTKPAPVAAGETTL